MNGASAKVFPTSSTIDSLPPRMTAMASMVSLGSISSISAPEVPGRSGPSNQVSPSWFTQSLTLPILTAKEVQAACELDSSSLAPICPSLEPTMAKVLSPGDQIKNSVEK